VIITGVVVLAAWIAVTNVRHWGDWIVLGVIIVTTFGFALAIYNPKYPTKKRTFVRTSKPDRYGRRR
jgi:hypothetical protein